MLNRKNPFLGHLTDFSTGNYNSISVNMKTNGYEQISLTVISNASVHCFE